jgi:hypothetical protein
MTYRTTDEIQEDIDSVRAAISAVVKGGQSYTINSGGSSRQVTQADLAGLKRWLADLVQEYRDTEGSGGLDIGASW